MFTSNLNSQTTWLKVKLKLVNSTSSANQTSKDKGRQSDWLY